MRHIPRFYCPETALHAGAVVTLPEGAAHHARVVLRLGLGDTLRLFNPENGEWQGTCDLQTKKSLAVRVTDQLKARETLPDVWLVLAPLKNKDAFDNAIRHAVELGVARIVLVQTERTQNAKINSDRLQQQIIDAAQQCGRLSVPPCDTPVPLKTLLRDWPAERRLLACVEGTSLPGIGTVAHNGVPAAVLIGPEGGLSAAEKTLLNDETHPWLQPVSLGPLILRSDTAVAVSVSALCL